MRNLKSIGSLLLVGLLGASAIVAAQGFPSPLGILPSPTESDQPLVVGVWTERSTYAVGEALVVHFSLNQPAFVYLFDLQPNGVVRLLFPNAYSQNSYVIDGTHTLPDGPYDLRVLPPTGVEELLIFASLTPLPVFPGDPADPYPVFASNPSDAMYQLRSMLSGITPVPTWKTGWTAFAIAGETSEPAAPSTSAGLPPFPPAYPPFTGYAGDAWYWQNGQWFSGFPLDGWYWYYGLDARWHLCLQIDFEGGLVVTHMNPMT